MNPRLALLKFPTRWKNTRQRVGRHSEPRGQGRSILRNAGGWDRDKPGSIAFPGIRGEPLSRFAVRLLLRKAVAAAEPGCPSLKKKRISPHTIRHGTAMALLDAGVDISVIALWLGHESIETTSGYLHTSLAMKQKALAKTTPSGTAFKRFRADDSLLAFLESL